jgi:apolipoprotein N-acyltransferase
MHPGYARDVVRAGADVLLVPSIDRWFASFGGRQQQLDAVSMRAIETRRFVLRPTADGITALIDPRGRVLAKAPIGVPATLEVSFTPRDEITFYVRYGDVGVGAAFLMIAIDAARRRRMRDGLPRSEGSVQLPEARPTGQSA